MKNDTDMCVCGHTRATHRGLIYGLCTKKGCDCTTYKQAVVDPTLVDDKARVAELEDAIEAILRAPDHDLSQEVRIALWAALRRSAPPLAGVTTQDLGDG